MTNFFTAIGAAYQAFVASYMQSDPIDQEDYADFESRRLRYAINWAMFENNVYHDLHPWAAEFKRQYGMYRWTRNLYNPTARLAEFYAAHLWGGQLDPGAGDGKQEPSVLPIITDNDNIRAGIAQLWLWSNWAITKDIVTLNGAVLGDQVIRVVDNPEKGRVYLERLHPSIVKALEKDDWGNVTGYTLEETRLSTLNPTQSATFQEVVTRDGDDVVYKTYLNNTPYAWNGIAAEWAEPYGFVPMVHIMHNNVGLDWGFSEVQASRSKFQEVDDLASLAGDQIRKAIQPKWVFTGVTKPKTTPVPTRTALNTTRPMPGREEEDAIYLSSPESKAQALVADLDIPGVAGHILAQLQEIERDYPELRYDNLRASGTVSGAALRIARQPAETKVLRRRGNYDDSLVRLHKMALSIGGMRGYKGFEGINEGSYEAGELDHTIGPRPVFFSDEIEAIETDTMFWQAAKTAGEAGADLAGYLETKGYAPETINLLVKQEPVIQTIEQGGMPITQEEEQDAD